jgi:hypothetical protein
MQVQVNKSTNIPTLRKQVGKTVAGQVLAPMAPGEMEAEVLRQKLMDTRKL